MWFRVSGFGVRGKGLGFTELVVRSVRAADMPLPGDAVTLPGETERECVCV